MERIIDLIERVCGREFRHIPGTGAAGGLACGFLAFTGARLERGIEIVLRHAHFAEKIKGADLIITGEGQIDGSTAYGKTIAGIAAEAKKHSVPVVAFAGRIGQDVQKVHAIGVQKVIRICDQSISQSQAMSQAEAFLADAVERFMRNFLKSR
jgi:glycerate kinase